jgi:hypothetical protein
MSTAPFAQSAPPTGAELDEFHGQDQATLLRRVRAATPRRRTNRKRRFLIGGIAVGVIAAGGAAYATRNAPPFVNEAVSDRAHENGQNLAKPDMVKIADVTLPDGSRFAAWHGRSEDFECDASADNWDGDKISGTGGVGCGPGYGDPGSSASNRLHLNWAAGKMKDVSDDNEVLEPWYPVAYGYVADSTVAKVELSGRLRLTGEDVHITVAVNPSTRGFGAVLPGSVDNKHYPMRQLGDLSGVTLTFLNAQGHEVGDAIRLRVMQ